MSDLHTSTFRVRQYECDALGHLNNANYLRYMLESAADTFELIGVNENRLTELGYSWRAREVNIEYIRPFTNGNVVLLKTMMIELGGDKLVLAFDFKKRKSEKSFAVSKIVYELSEIKGGQKVPIPKEIRMILNRLDRGELSLRMEETFEDLSPPQGAYSLPWRIEWRDVGSNQKLMIASYLDYLVDFVLTAAADCGWTHKRSLNAGIAWMVKRQSLKVLQDAVFEDELVFSTWISNFKRSTVTRDYLVHRGIDGTLIAKARTLWIALDAESGRPKRIPEEWKQDFSSQIFIR